MFFFLHTHKKHCGSVTLSTRPGGHCKDRPDMSYTEPALDKTIANGLMYLPEQIVIQNIAARGAKFEKRSKHLCKHKPQY